jgi:predicted ATPase
VFDLVGRDRDLAEIEAAIRQGAKLVTLVGAGGVGKTTLARAHAQGGGLFVDLSAARDPREAVSLLAAALGVTLDGGDEPEAAVARAAAERGSLLVADNLEQLSPEGRAVVVRLAEHARVVATSREPLGVASEHAIRILPLEEADAIALLSRLSGVVVDAEVARAIVRRLDNLPLAIELAAARVPLLGPRDLLARLDRKLDVLTGGRGPARHASLRAAIAWSWELLDAHERDALSACAAFEAPFDAALALDVIGEGAIDVLAALRDRALLHASGMNEDGRASLSLLESVRDFARSATTADPSAIADRHAEAVLARTEPLAEDVACGRAVPPELARRRADLLVIARRTGNDARLAARAVCVLAELLAVTGPLALVVELAASPSFASLEPALRGRVALARAGALRAIGRLADAESAAREALSASDPQLEGGALLALAAIARARGDVDGALSAADVAIARYRAVGDRAREGLAIGVSGAAHQTAGRLSLARERHAEAIALHAAASARRAEGVSRSHLAVAVHRGGDVARSASLHEEALAIHREVGDRRMAGAEHLHLGFVHHELGDAKRAREWLTQARALLAGAGARGLEALALVLLARLAVDERDEAAALVELAEANLVAPRGWARLAATTRLVEGHLAMMRGDAGAAREAYAAALGTSDDVEVGFEALTPAYLALAAARLRDPGAAAEALARARARVSDLENRHLHVALAILAAGVHGEAAPPSGASLGASSEVRRAAFFVGAPRALSITADARSVGLPDGRAIDLGRRKNVRLVLLALAEARRDRPGSPLSAEALVHAGWPGERMRAEAATKRLHTAIWTLRSLGLEDLLLTDGEGYLLDPRVLLHLGEL